jgi:sucrose-6F-phosphate phosphohydrolase
MILIATDLDRTLLPNGPAEDDGGIPRLFAALAGVAHRLAYVTGRDLALFHEAQQEYGIPTPDYLIASVGTVVYRKEDGTLVEDARWRDAIAAHEPAWDRDRITAAVGTAEGLSLQEPAVQNRFKISYYLPAHASKDTALAHIRAALANLGIDAQVVWSVDPLKNLGLIDLLPESATKATAVEFLRVQEGLTKEQVVYCGDSGNDILPLTSGYRSILVNNALPEVKEEVTRRVASGAASSSFYLATGASDGNGNYAAGILEGLRHFGVV